MNDEAIVQLLTEIRDNQVREFQLREQALARARNAGDKLQRWTTVALVVLGCVVAFQLWNAHRTEKRIQEWQMQREQAEW